MSLTPKLLQQGAAGSARPVYIEDVFSTYLYTGNGSTQTITNGIDLAGKGGLVWIKSRSSAVEYHNLFDTARGAANVLFSNTTDASASSPTRLSSFGTTGFTVGSNSATNASSATLASWTFRKQPKFFDIVTYTGNGTTQTVSHSLGSKPGFILCKATSTTSDWAVWHRGNGTTGYSEFSLNSDSAASATSDSTISTTTNFKPSAIFDATVTAPNVNGVTYAAYLFAHNAGGFGLTGNDNVISCGSYTGTGAAGNAITLGYEPQWLMIKRTDSIADWVMFDNIRGMPVAGSADAYLRPHLSAAEGTASTGWVSPNATGFEFDDGQSRTNISSGTYIYIAIRRGPMKVPTSGTSVFSPALITAASGGQQVTTNFVTDTVLTRHSLAYTISNAAAFFSRLQGQGPRMYTNTSSSEGTNATYSQYWDYSTGFYDNFGGGTTIGLGNCIDYGIRRAPGFFDEVCRTGALPTVPINHNLGVVPELIIEKTRGSVGDWYVWTATQYGRLNVTNAFSSSTQTMTATTYTPLVNGGGETYVAYLFASCPGVSKVGSYTGNGSTQTIDCGFAAGARFVLIKRTDSTDDWYVFDTARGIIAGNDPFLKLNTTAAEVTSYDAVDPANSGFIVNNDATNYPINVASATYIFLAIA